MTNKQPMPGVGCVIFTIFITFIPINTAIWSPNVINPLTPNDPCSGRTAPLTSKRCVFYIYSTNTDIEYFKHGIHSPFLSLQNAVCFIILKYLVYCFIHILYTECAKIKKKSFRRQTVHNVLLKRFWHTLHSAVRNYPLFFVFYKFNLKV